MSIIDQMSRLPIYCSHCGMYHSQVTCPRIKAIEYHPNGTIKRVEYHDRPTIPEKEQGNGS